MRCSWTSVPTVPRGASDAAGPTIPGSENEAGNGPMPAFLSLYVAVAGSPIPPGVQFLARGQLPAQDVSFEQDGSLALY